jgi:3-oxoacyl-[acyl-carrier-protein] synthase II
MSFPYIVDVSAVTGLGGNWSDTWQRLLCGSASLSRTTDIAHFGQTALTVSAIPELSREVGEDGKGPASSLFTTCLSQLSLHTTPRVYAGSNHGEAELMRNLLTSATPGQAIAILDEQLAHTALGRARWTYAACASGLYALVAAVFDYMDGYLGDAVVVSADALSLIETIGFARVGALATDRARPFAVNRDGLMIGEGAAAMLLSSDCAKSDRIRILGVGMSCDGFHPTDPDPSGEHLERAIRMALNTAGLSPNDVAAVVAHGTGTIKGDAIEAKVIDRVWSGIDVLVTSVKGHVGHLMGAAGLFNALTAYEACRSGCLPPIGPDNGEMLEAGCVVTGSSERFDPGAPVLCLASGFGGNNVAVLVGQSQAL